MNGWMMWRDGKPHSFALDRAKEDLLIGYDMISLRGLDATEQFLASRGMVAHLTEAVVVEEGQHYCFAVTVRGELVPKMLSWSVCSETAGGAMERAAGYLGHFYTLPEGDHRDLLTYWLFRNEFERDGRRRGTLAKLRVRVEAVLAREQVEACPLVFRMLEGD